MSSNVQLWIRWDTAVAGSFSVINGKVNSLRLVEGTGTVAGPAFAPASSERATLVLEVEVADSRYGATVTRVEWQGESAFAFIPTHLPETPVRVADFGVTLARSEDALSAPLPEDPEPAELLPTGRGITWEAWAARNKRPHPVPTVLGVGRDQRYFIADVEKEVIQASIDLRHPQINYILDRAVSADPRCTRWLEDGHLPILHSRQRHGVLELEETFFATFADRPLTEENVAGTPLRYAHLKSVGPTFPAGEREEVEKGYETFQHEGELVLYHRLRITNTSSIPRLSSHRFPRICPTAHRDLVPVPPRLNDAGVMLYGERPVMINRFNGEIPTSIQPTLLLQPGETMVLDSVLAHSRDGLSAQAVAAGLDWDGKLAETKAYWLGKLPALPELPDERMNHFWKAGLHHLEMVTLGGREESLIAKVGVYTAIGSESIPMIDFYDSVGLHETAERCLNAFYDLQHADGRINLFTHYDIETGGVLFQSGQHFDFTQNIEWVKARTDGIRKAADYLLSLRQLDHPEAANYGLIAGTCADPLDLMTSFMLNAYNGAGILAAARLLSKVGEPDAEKYQEAAEKFIVAFRKAFAASFQTGPIAPYLNSEWVPTMAPWVEGIGLQTLGLKGESCYTHRCYNAYDTLLGPLYGVYTGLIDPDDQQVGWLLKVNTTHLNRAAISESQPYYARHPEAHLLRGEREAFLNSFFSGLTSLADRDTFTFWEHLFDVSIHKTHEEGWALMQARRMLWVEKGDTLQLLSGIPEEWLDEGKKIAFEGCSTFGKLSLKIVRHADRLEVNWVPDFHAVPREVVLHLPGLRVNGSDKITFACGNQAVSTSYPIARS